MSLHFEAFGSGLDFDVNGLHRGESTSGGGGGLLGGLLGGGEPDPYAGLPANKKPNEARFKKHMYEDQGKQLYDKIYPAAGVVALVGIVLFGLGAWPLGILFLLFAAGLVGVGIYWKWWSNGLPEHYDENGVYYPTTGAGKYLEFDENGCWRPKIDPETGQADPHVRLMLDYSDLTAEYIKFENRLRALIVGGKTLPPTACDDNVWWKCTEFDDISVTYLIHIEQVNGMVSWFNAAKPELRAEFGDVTRGGELIKLNNAGDYRMTLYGLPGNVQADVSW